MGNEKRKTRMPVTQEKIFRIMMIITFAVSGIFLLKNLIGRTFQGAIIIGVCLAVFLLVVLAMAKLNVSSYVRQFVLCIALVVLVFIISANSGNFYSDDFPLFLALIGLGGLYLEPRYTQVQMVLITVALIVLYLLHPEKADPLSQYIMCLVLLNVAGIAFYLTIQRGRAFIDMSQEKAAEAHRLLDSIQNIGTELQRSYDTSSGRMEKLRTANEQMETNTAELTQGAEGVNRESHEVTANCDDVHQHMLVTEQSVDQLNSGVEKLEDALNESKQQMQEMNTQIQSVHHTMDETTQVFTQLQKQIQEIGTVTDQLSDISFNTNILALNAAIEAARAGSYGAGFAVVANEVQRLAAESEECSGHVIQIVDNMRHQIRATSTHMVESSTAITSSLQSLGQLEQGFGHVMDQFHVLYQHIEAQNQNISDIDQIFDELKQRAGDMSIRSEENCAAVTSIVEAMAVYKRHMTLVMDDIRRIHDLSATMVETAK